MYDLNVPWPDGPLERAVPGLVKSLEFRMTLGYRVFAITVSVEAGAVPGYRTPFPPPILKQVEASLPSTCRILTRVTVIMPQNSAQAPKLASLASTFDIIALQVDSERALQSAATALDIDVISFNFSARQSFFVKHGIAAAAVARGVRFELPYGQAAGDPAHRRQAIANASALIRATRGRGLLATSSSCDISHVRSPADVLNLLILWGLDAQRAHDALYKCPETSATRGILRRRSHSEAVYVAPTDPERPKKKPKLSS